MTDPVRFAAETLERRTSRRGFLVRAAVLGSALAVAPLRYLLRPATALAGSCGRRMPRRAVQRRLDRVLLHDQRRSQRLPRLHLRRRLVEVHELPGTGSAPTRACATTSTAIAAPAMDCPAAATARTATANRRRSAATSSARASATPRSATSQRSSVGSITCEQPGHDPGAQLQRDYKRTTEPAATRRDASSASRPASRQEFTW